MGWYAIDIHGQATDIVYIAPTKPFQIPLGALVSRHLDNLLAACKNIGTTHITNGCYRLHPVEWNIGEAAGALAAFCLGQQQTPADVCSSAALRRQYQQTLLAAGVPLYWYEDVPLGHPAFAAVQMLAVEGIWPGCADHLRFDPDALADAPTERLRAAGLSPDLAGRDPITRGDLARRMAQHL